MAQANLTENLSEMVSKALKKTEVFEKILKIEFYVGSFVFISSIMGLSCIYMNFSSNFTSSFKKQIEENDNKVKSDFFILNTNLAQLVENQQNITVQLEELKVYICELKSMNKSPDYNRISTSTSMSSFSPIKITNTIFEDAGDHDYDELMNECYDTIPLNNLKKNTGLSWIFK